MTHCRIIIKTINANLLIACLAMLALQGCINQQPNNTLAIDSDWYTNGAAAVEKASNRPYNNSPGAAKNIILFIGDGMGVSTVSAARIFAGQQLGQSGEEYVLSFETFPWTGLVKTYNTDAQVPDSAGTATAIMSGVKTRSGVIGIDGRPERGSCESYLNTEGASVISALELAEIAGKATGVISTATITHATPASAYAHVADRNWETSRSLPNEAKQNGCTDIAQQLVDMEARLEAKVNNSVDHPDIDGLDLAFGGGRGMFFGEDPVSLTGFAEGPGEGRRDDGQNLIATWQSRGGRYIMDQAGFDNLDTDETSNVLGLFQTSHMRYEADRHNDEAGEPSLTEMTLKAIELLQQDNDGFFLMVESGRVDHAHHVNNAYNALNDAAELSRAVDATLAAVDLNDTLIIVTADHSHVMTFAGYPARNNPILGIAGQDSNGNPYTTLNYANGAGFDDNGSNTDANTRSGPPAPGRHDLTGVDTTAPGYHQESLVGTFAETHGGEDVGVYAIGPGGHLLSGVIEQNVIFHVMNFAGDLSNKAVRALE